MVVLVMLLIEVSAVRVVVVVVPVAQLLGITAWVRLEPPRAAPVAKAMARQAVRAVMAARQRPGRLERN
jgi:hypothetical protein